MKWTPDEILEAQLDICHRPCNSAELILRPRPDPPARLPRPNITQAILDGTQPQDLTLARLRRALPLASTEQRQALGFPATATPAEPAPCP